jgi:hypothetical protein
MGQAFAGSLDVLKLWRIFRNLSFGGTAALRGKAPALFSAVRFAPFFQKARADIAGCRQNAWGLIGFPEAFRSSPFPG